MLTGTAAGSFHGSGQPGASYIRTETPGRLFNQGRTTAGERSNGGSGAPRSLLGEGAQPAEGAVLGDPDGTG